MGSSVKRGTSFVSVMAVVSCLGMLTATLLPAVQSAKESSRTVQCGNNLRQLGISVLQYDKIYQRFPGYRNHLRPGPKVVTWVVSVFPYVGRPKIHHEWAKLNYNDTQGKEQVPKVTMELMICPNNPPRAIQKAPSDYVCNAGFARTTDLKGDVFAVDQNDKPYNGVFLDHSQYGNEGNAKTPIVTLDYLNASDGSSDTLMLGENFLVETWSHWVHFNRRNNYETYVPKQAMSFVWHKHGSGTIPNLHPSRLINGNQGTTKLKDLNQASLNSFHAKGANVVFCDGHNRYLNEDIDYHVYIQLMTPNGSKSVAAGDSPTMVKIKPGEF